MEDRLALSPETMSEQRVRLLLERFHRFYLAWEPWVLSTGIAEDFLRPRLKLSRVRADLAALGATDLDRVAPAPLNFGRPGVHRGMGSLYVVEGSTLGGQILKRWMRGATWMPEGGLSYFDSYGDEVGPMWRAFARRLESESGDSGIAEATDAANETFSLMERWLADGPGGA